MIPSRHLLLTASLVALCPLLATAQAPTVPAPSTAPAKPPAKAADTESKARTVSLDFRGTLREALQQIARQSGVNLVATGALDTEVEVHLAEVSGPAALRTVAQAYQLELKEQEGVFTLRPAVTGASNPAPPPLPVPPGMKVPPVPPAPPPGLSPDEVQEWAADQAERAQEAAEAARQFAQEQEQLARESAETMRGWVHEQRAAARQAAAEAREVERNAREVERNAHRLANEERDGEDLVVRGRSHTVEKDQTVGDILLYGGTLHHQGKARGDVAVFGGSMRLDGEVDGDVVVLGGNLVLDGRVEGDVHTMGGSVQLGPHAVVKGSVSALGGTVERAVGARVGGTRVSLGRGATESEESHDDGEGFGSWLGSLLLRFALLFGIGFLFMLFAPQRMKVMGEDMRTHSLPAGATGLLALIATVPLVVMLCVTIVGIPVAILLLALMPVGIAMGVTAFANEIGLHLPVLRGRKTQAVILALGLALLVFISTIPVVGPLTMAVVSLLALGALVRTRFGGRPQGGLPTPVAEASTL